MDRTRRDKPDDKLRTSQLIQQLAAQRERKLQASSNSTAGGQDVTAASSIPLPSSFDEEDDLCTQPPSDTPPTAQKARSRLVRRDKASSAQHPAAHPDSNDVDSLASLLQGVGISTAGSSRSHETARQGTAGSNNSIEDPIEDDDEDSDSISAVGRAATSSAAAASQQQRRQAAGGQGSGRSAPAHTAAALSSEDGSEGDEEEGDVASVDSASSSGSDQAIGSSSQQAGSSRAAPAAQPLALDGGFVLDGAVARKLYPHQIQGVKWLWSLHMMGKGGILADDMGLGKTMQCSAFLAGALAASRSSSSLLSANPAAAAAAGGGSKAAAAAAAPVPVRALIVAPKTLLAHWEKELRVCGMGRATHSFYGSSEGERSAVLTTITRRGGIMLTTYGMVLHNASQLMSGKGSAVARDIDEHEDEEDLLCPDPPPGRRILWDYIILDEGHKIKNARTQLAQRLREIRARVRVIISGTPVQNNLGELHALMEFATPGLLGTAKDFKEAYEKPINAGQDRSATLRVRELGAARAAELRKLVAPYILRREKKEVLGDGTGTKSTSSAGAGTGQDQPTNSTGSSASRVSSTSGPAGVVAAAAGGVEANTAAAAAAAASGGAAGPAPMGKKTDLVVWLRLTALQRHIYEAFLHSDAVKAALNSSKSPLAALTVLKKVCDHPALLSERATKLVVSAAAKPSRRKGLDTSGSRPGSKQSSSKGKPKRRDSMDDFIVDDSDSGGDYDEDESGSCDSDSSSGGRGVGGSKAAAARAAVAASLDTFSEEFLSWATATGNGENLEKQLLSDVGARGTESSCKSLFVAALLDELVAGGHRTLVFSQSRVMLDILQAAVKARGWNFCRIDGSVVKAEARQAEVERFQTAPGGTRGIPVFLLTTQVGGLGLTLTAADRVVIVDPSWNPATDNQSVDRAYRIGQSRDVVVYRLVTCGTVEEKIYRKQVFKGGLSRAGMEEGIHLRYFTHQELHELFKWDPEALNTSETQQLLKQQHAPQLRALHKQQGDDLNSHIGWVEDHPLCSGTSQHGLLFSCQDPEGRELNLNDPSLSSAAAGYSSTGSSTAAGGRRFRGPGGHPQQGGFWGSQGGAGGSGGVSSQPSAAALDDMMRSLHIDGSSDGVGRGGGLSATAARGGLMQQQWGGAQGSQQQQQQRVQELLKSIKQLQAAVHSSTCDLQRLGPNLPDGGAKIAVRRDSLQAGLDKELAELKQLDPQAAAAALSGAPGNSSLSSQGVGHSQQQPHQQQQGRIGWQQSQGGPFPPASQQIPQQQRQQPPPPPRQQQPQWQQPPLQPPRQEQQQHHWPDALPPPPPHIASRAVQQQQHAAKPTQLPPPHAQLGGRDGKQSTHAAQHKQQRPGVQTLDGRVPTVNELRQRKHVLKKALQQEDRLKEQLSTQGRPYPEEKQQQWRQMYAEYKEIKQVLQAVEQAEQQEAGAGNSGSSGRQGSNSEVIDLT